MQTVRNTDLKKQRPPHWRISWQTLFITLLITGITIGSFIVDIEGLLLIPFLMMIWQKTSGVKVINL